MIPGTKPYFNHVSVAMNASVLLSIKKSCRVSAFPFKDWRLPVPIFRFSPKSFSSFEVRWNGLCIVVSKVIRLFSLWLLFLIVSLVTPPLLPLLLIIWIPILLIHCRFGHGIIFLWGSFWHSNLMNFNSFYCIWPSPGQLVFLQ